MRLRLAPTIAGTPGPPPNRGLLLPPRLGETAGGESQAERVACASFHGAPSRHQFHHFSERRPEERARRSGLLVPRFMGRLLDISFTISRRDGRRREPGGAGCLCLVSWGAFSTSVSPFL